MKENKSTVIFITFTILFILTNIQSGEVYTDTPTINLWEVNSSVQSFLTSKINCKSDSMGLVMNCMDTIYSVKVYEKTKLKLGRIYIYESGNHTVVHRLVLDCSKGCYGYVFKGDNNYVAEVVNRSQIIRKVYQVGFK